MEVPVWGQDSRGGPRAVVVREKKRRRRRRRGVRGCIVVGGVL